MLEALRLAPLSCEAQRFSEKHANASDKCGSKTKTIGKQQSKLLHFCRYFKEFSSIMGKCTEYREAIFFLL